MACRSAIVLGLLLLNLTSAIRAEAEDVLLASRHAGWIEVFDADSLNPISRIRVGPNADTMNASPDGKIFYLSQGIRDDPTHGCCSVYAVDLQNRNMKFVSELNGPLTVTNDKLFVGYSVFDIKSRDRLPPLKSRTAYHLHASPDGRWIVGITNSGDWVSKASHAGPSVDIFDLQTNERVHQLSVPYKEPVGTWIGEGFYIVAVDGQTGHLWRVDANTTTLGVGQEFELPGLDRDSKYQFLAVVALNGHLFLHEVFGMKIDPRSRGQQIEGGIFEIDPVKAQVIRRLVPELHFSQVIASKDGTAVYGVDVPSWTTPRLVKIDAIGNKTTVIRDLPSDIWHIEKANVTSGLLNQAEIEILVK